MVKRLGVIAEMETTSLEVAVIGLPGGAGVAVDYTQASSSVGITNISNGAAFEYKAGAGPWAKLQPSDGVELPIDLATTALAFRRARYDGGLVSASLVVSGQPTLRSSEGGIAISAGAGSFILPAATTAQLGGLKPDNVTIIVDPTTGAATSPVTPNYKLLPKFAAAVSKARTGVKRAKIMLVSDSNGIGYGSGSDGTTAAARYSANSRKNSFLAQLARLMTQYFCNASFQGFAGSGNLQNAGELAQFDPRFAFPVAGWTPIAEKDGMLPFSSATDGHKMTFTPDVPVDNFVLDWKSTPYGATAAGSFSYQVDAGAVVTVDALTEFGPRTISAGSLGAHTLTITKVGAQRVILLTLDAYNSTVPGIDMMLYGYNGGTGAEYTNGTGCLAKMAGYASDLTFLMLMTNEMGANSSTGTFKTNQQKIITNAKLTGDVLLITPPPLSPTGSTYPRTLAEQLVYINIYRDLARENGIQILDLWSRWVTRDAGGLLGYYNGSGDLHPSMVGNADIAGFIFKSITAI